MHASSLPAGSCGWGCNPTPAAERSVSVTIYNDDLALVQDRRDIELKGGRQRIEFQDVSAQIRPETASLTAGDISIVEQNFDFDLLTPAKLMEKAVGHEVTIVRVNPATGAETREQAEVLATNGGVVLKIGQRIEVLRDDGLPVRVIFDKVPENLARAPHAVGHRHRRSCGHAAGHLELPHAGTRLEGGLCGAVRRGRRQNRRAGLGDADQFQRRDL